jgi:hypothetical protein
VHKKLIFCHKKKMSDSREQTPEAPTDEEGATESQQDVTNTELLFTEEEDPESPPELPHDEGLLSN